MTARRGYRRTDHRCGGFSLIEMMIAVAILGILAAIATPQLVRYMYQARTTEAEQMLGQIYDGARIYFLDTHAGGATMSGAITSRQFPGSVPATPAVNCCVSGGRCSPRSAYWDTDTWRALKFSVDAPHYYRYDFSSSGTGVTSEFYARAYGDLDCDGQLSTFSMYANASLLTSSGEVTGTAQVYKKDQLE